MKKYLLICLAVICGYTVACEQYTTPESILLHADASGEKDFVQHIIHNKKDWTYILSQITSGDTAWLQVAEYLKDHSDASATSALNYAVSHALKNTPDNVLAILGRQYSVKKICRSPFIEENIDYEAGFLKAIRSAVTTSTYRGENKARCLNHIRYHLQQIRQQTKRER